MAEVTELRLKGKRVSCQIHQELMLLKLFNFSGTRGLVVIEPRRSINLKNVFCKIAVTSRGNLKNGKTKRDRVDDHGPFRPHLSFDS